MARERTGRCRLRGLGIGTAVVLAFGMVAPRAAHGVETTLGGRPLTIRGRFELREVVPVNGSTADDKPWQQLWADGRLDLTDTVAVALTINAHNGGPTTKADQAGTYSFRKVFQSLTPAIEFEEAFLDWRGEHFTVRAGKQKFAWGKLDRTQPTDILNTFRYDNPFLQEESERKIGVPALHVAYYASGATPIGEEVRIGFTWIPRYIPFRFPLPGERWFPPAAVSPKVFGVPAGLVPLPDGTPNPPFSVPIAFRVRNPAAPAFRMDNAGYAVRLSGFAAGVDYAIAYYHGFDKQPAFEMTAEATAVPDPMNPLGLDISATTELTPIFRTVDLFGADAAYTWDRFAFRLEAAYVRNRPFSRDLRLLVRDPAQLGPEIQRALGAFQAGVPRVPIDLGISFVQRDTVEWGAGVDTTVQGYFVLLQVNQTDVLDNAVDLLIEDVETRIGLNVRKSFWHGDLKAQVVALHAIESDYTVVHPRLTYRLTDAVDARVGYLLIAGRSSSLLGQYGRNDEGYLRLRYRF